MSTFITRPGGRERVVLVALEGAFLASRAIYALAGVRFDATPIFNYWQIIDPHLLRHDLFRSLWYLHGQPPLYNLLLGLVLHVAGPHPAGAFQAVYLLAGMVLVASLFLLLRGVGASRSIAVGAVLVVVVVNPAAVLYENWLYVEYFVVVLLVVACLLLLRFVQSGRTWLLVAFFTTAAVVVLSRSIFNLAWLLITTGALVVLRRGEWKRIFAAAAVPIALCVGWYTKNLVQFGSFTGSTCLGLNLERVTTFWVSEAERQDLIRQGRLSRYAVLDPYSLPSTAPEAFRGRKPTGVPILDEPDKSTGAANFDSLPYLNLCRALERDARTVLRLHPRLIATSARAAILIYFRPASDYTLFSDRNRSSVADVEHVFNLLALQPRAFTHATDAPASNQRVYHPSTGEVAWLLVALYACAWAVAVAVLCRPHLRRRLGPATTAFVVFATVTMGYLTVVGNLLEVGENNRFHIVLDPLAVAMVVVGATALLRDGQRAVATEPEDVYA